MTRIHPYYFILFLCKIWPVNCRNRSCDDELSELVITHLEVTICYKHKMDELIAIQFMFQDALKSIFLSFLGAICG